MAVVSHAAGAESYFYNYFLQAALYGETISVSLDEIVVQTGAASELPGLTARFSGSFGDVGAQFTAMQFSLDDALVAQASGLALSFDANGGEAAALESFFEQEWDYRGSSVAEAAFGGGADDTFRLFAGNDVVEPYAGRDLIRGGVGSDTVTYAEGAEQGIVLNLAKQFAIDAWGDRDTLIAIENAIGTEFDDLMLGAGTENLLDGGAGLDRLNGRGGNDWLRGGEGDDLLIGANGADLLEGGAGNDRLMGSADDDQLSGDGGNDLLNGQRGDDTLAGGDGDDWLHGGDGDDAILGGAGADRLNGAAGADRLAGGAGNDALRGGNGIDRLVGGGGDDLLIGGADLDVFVYDGSDFGTDTIRFWRDGEDRIEISLLSVSGFENLTITQTESGALIAFGDGTILLEDRASGVIGAEDFIFL
ncbi:MAG: hypothetical protein MRY63_07710 [Neomegalonema sp.]|nr:hypothetical protein [Neomegalonema sp.]